MENLFSNPKTVSTVDIFRFMQQRGLERAASIKMAILLFIGAFVFAFAPNPASFAVLAENGWGFAPQLLAILNFCGGVAYLWMLRPQSFNYTRGKKILIFYVASLPILSCFTVDFIIPLIS